jgi:hypothetical protein
MENEVVSYARATGSVWGFFGGLTSCLPISHAEVAGPGRHASNFMTFVAVLTGQIDARSEAELDLEMASSAKEAASLLSPAQVCTACAHESVGRNGVRSGGGKCAKQQRCDLCVKAGRKEPNGSGSWHASWRCRAHPDVHVCKSRDRPCMVEHLANIANGS